MEPQARQNSWKIVAIISLLLLALGIALLTGWLLGRNDNTTNNTQASTASEQDQPASEQASAGRVTDLVAFDVPGGWKQASCDDVDSDVVYFIPSSDVPDCANVPEFSMTLAVDPQSYKDCNQLQNVQDVSKHICKSVFIDNRKTLQAQTIYTQDSDVLPGRTVDSYYMDTGNGVVLARHVYTGEPENGTAFNDLVNSLRAR